ncbi:pur operon repressor [Pediococcus argentinicus]|nr:pur operon repressor [Pediococcus argentinicus]NKZ22057.1 pur operon repressor [Pediococcus argentinicus]GEP19396.1 pur operon repressor [Pediococcus argentinicus]
MKLKRSERLVDMTYFMLNHPRQLVAARYFVEKYQSAKSSISEDLGILKNTMETQQFGTLKITSGAAGGVQFFPKIGEDEAREVIEQLTEELSDPSRKLPGGYLYMSDLLGDPKTLRNVGRMLANEYVDSDVQAVMTVETKGIPLAQAVANYLDVPFIIVRHDARITEGSTISVNYVSRSSEQIKKMELSKRSLQKDTNVLIVDDFLKGGGTIQAMTDLLKEFEANMIGISVLAEGNYNGDRAIDNFTSILKVNTASANDVSVSGGNYLERNFKK